MSNILAFFSVFKIIGLTFAQYWWVILPWPLYKLFKFLWLDFANARWSNSLSWTLLEIIPPKDVEKGPKLMESLYQTMTGVVVSFNVFDEYLNGMFTDRFSLELVSLGGVIHFYVRTQTKYRNMIEAAIYAQFPDAEIIEAEDYTQNFPKVIPNKDWDLWGSDLELTKPDAYPIRTYDKFEESNTGVLIDPMAGFVELFGTLREGQNMWFQIVVSPEGEGWGAGKKQVNVVRKLAGRTTSDSKGIFGHLVDVLANIIPGMLGPIEFAAGEKKEEQPLEFRLTPVERDVLKAVEENLGKNAYTVKMRMLYLGKKEGFDKSYISAFFGAMRQFNDLNLNNLKPENLSKTYAQFVSVDQRLQLRKRKIYRRYKERNMEGKKFVLSVSELATVFHFPHMDVKAPALTRIESKRGAAPANLPVG